MSNQTSVFSDDDRDAVVDRYTKRFNEHGYSQAAVGWGKKGRQELRFEILLSGFDCNGRRLLDLGAGFGDLFQYAAPLGIASYQGLELTPALVAEGISRFGSDKRFNLDLADVEGAEEFPETDITLVSGMFNFKLSTGENYAFIERQLGKALRVSRDGVAANFITDRVDYHEDLIFNSRPEKILEIALSLSRNVQLRADYMPFEFTVFIYRDDTFDPSDAIFKRFKEGR